MISPRNEAELLRAAFAADADAFSRRPNDAARGAAIIIAQTIGGTPNDIQDVALVGPATGGSFRLSRPTVGTTEPLAWNSSAGAVQTALEPLYGVGNVVCTAGPLPGQAVRCTFGGALLNLFVPRMIGDPSGLSGPRRPYLEVRVFHLAGGEASYPAVARAQYRLLPGPISGTEVDGQAQAFATVGRTIYAFNLGDAIPPVGTTVRVSEVPGTYVFRW
jgi:hypothetical protein